MMAQEDYLVAWLYYLAGVGFLFGCWWYLTAKIRWPELRQLLRVILIVTLLLPWYGSDQHLYLAPAWLMSAIEGLFEGTFWRAGLPLLLSIAASLLLSLIFYLIRWYMRSRALASSNP